MEYKKFKSVYLISQKFWVIFKDSQYILTPYFYTVQPQGLSNYYNNLFQDYYNCKEQDAKEVVFDNKKELLESFTNFLLYYDLEDKVILKHITTIYYEINLKIYIAYFNSINKWSILKDTENFQLLYDNKYFKTRKAARNYYLENTILNKLS